jgi:hypothetical protein
MDAKNSQKRLYFAAVGASVAHGACTLKAHRFRADFLFPVANINMSLYLPLWIGF